jgi:hypothetical protein
MYLTNTRTYIYFVVNTLSQYMVEPIRVHLIAIKHEINLLGYSDSDWADNVANRKSTLGCCFTLGSGMISWIIKKKPCVEINTTEAEYVASCATSYEEVRLRKLLTVLYDIAMESTCILCNNQICIKLLENPMFHDKSKHIEIMYHYIRDMV